MVTAPVNTDAFSSYIDEVSLELYSQEEWETAKGIDDLLGLSEHNDMCSEVFNLAFERRPELFKDIQWVNSDYGFPLWVRPGVEWRLEDDEDEDEYWD